jgi:tripartite-type tricarboxylate transporter receptor subunit TctC
MKKLVACLLPILFCLSSTAQTTFPTGPVRIVVPYPPGAITDTLPRMVAELLREEWGQTVILDNRPGAGGRIATEFVAKSAPDGHTLLVALPDTLVLAPKLYKKLSYSTKDFVPITLMAKQAFVVVVRQDLAANSFSQLIDLAKSQPGQLKMSSWGEGSAGHLALEWLKQSSGVDILHVPYKGAQAALTDVIGKQVDMMITGYSTAGPHLKSGRLKVLARTASARSALTPEIASVSEFGYAGYDVQSWYGIVAPAGTPSAIVEKIHKSIAKALTHPSVIDKVNSYYAEMVGAGPQAFAQVINEDADRWSVVIKAANIQLDGGDK